MKCLKTVDGKIMESRYRDEVAARMVASGAYTYAPKEEWKCKVRDIAKRASTNDAKDQKQKDQKQKDQAERIERLERRRKENKKLHQKSNRD